MFKRPSFLVLLLLLLPSINTIALEVTDLYQATVVVDSQTRAEREKAIGKALQGVFLKVGGKESVLENKLLIQAQKKPSTYVTQYRYQRINDVLSIVVSFNENKVNTLFRKAELALWGSLRPQVLLWLVDEQGPARSIVSYDANSMFPASVNDFSAQRGLPIIMPLMDLTDSEQVVVSDFWGYFPEKIQQASSRYFADTVIVMRVSDSSLVRTDLNEANIPERDKLEGFLQSTQSITDNTPCDPLCEEQKITTPVALDWKVYTQGALYIQRYQGVDKVALVTQALSDITELIYQSYALSATIEGDFVIEVNNVSSLTDDTQLFDFLDNLSAVKSVTLISAQENVRRYQLELIGSRDSFLASLKLNNKLTEQIKPLIENGYSPMEFDAEGNHTRALSRNQYMGMKVIVLGETPPADNISDDINTPKVLEQNLLTEQSETQSIDILAEGTLEEDILDVVENSSVNAVDKATKGKQDQIDSGELFNKGISESANENINDSVTDEDIVPSDDEQLKALLDDKVPLTIKPNVPVFSWEQG